ncbi:DinB family protein, partial [bacterium]
MTLAEEISQLKSATEEGKQDMLKTFEFIPDDKLRWTPSETARWPLWIVGHCGLANLAFAAMLRGEPMDMPSDPAEAGKMIHEAGRDLMSREEAVKLIEESS